MSTTERSLRTPAWLLLLPPLLLLGAGRRASAQDALTGRALGPTPAQLAAVNELARAHGTRVRARWDAASGGPARLWFDPPLPLPPAARAPETAARAALRLVEPVWGRLPLDEQRERRGPHLTLKAVREVGPLRRVSFLQLLGAVEVDGAELVVTVGRREGRCVLVEVAGRAFLDVPWALTPLPPAAGARQVVAWTGRGWRALLRREETGAAGLPEEVLRGARGVVVLRRSLVLHGSAAALLDGGAVPLRDLQVEAGGALAVTDALGRFPGDAASLPAGLSGPSLRVLPSTTRPWPATRDGRLLLAFPAGDPRREELALWHGLQATERFYAAIPGVGPGGAAHTVVVRLADAMVNAFAYARPAEAEGRSYDAMLAFGRGLGLDRTVVSHERGHAFVRLSGGFDWRESLHEKALQEALADYLTAAEHGTTLIGGEGLGDWRRDIDDDRVYPWHEVPGSAHATGVIFSGAVWDARREAGAQAAEVDAALVRAIRRLHPGVTLPGAAELLAEEAPPGPLREVVTRHLRAHGLLPAAEAGPPVLEVLSPAQARTGPLSLTAGQEARLVLQAWDPSDPCGAEGEPPRSSAEVLVGGAPEWAQAEPATTTLATDPSGRRVPVRGVEVVLCPPLGAEGAYELTLSASSIRSGQVATRTLPVRVAPAGPAAPQGSRFPALTLEVRVGERREVSLPELFSGVQAGRARWALTGTSPLGTDYIPTSGVARVTGAAAIQGDALVVAPEPGEEGTHLFWLQAEPEGRRDPARLRWREVRLIVRGRDPGGLHAFEAVRPEGGRVETGVPAAWQLVPPGAELTVHRGSALLLHLVGTAERPGELELADDRPPAASLEPAIAPPSAVADLLRRLDPGAGYARALGGLAITPAAEGPYEVLEVTVLLQPSRREPEAAPPGTGEAGPEATTLPVSAARPLARRTLRVIVLPRAPAATPLEGEAAPAEGAAPTRGITGVLGGK